MRKRLKKNGKIKNAILEYVNANAKTYIITILILSIGIIIGIIFVNNTNETQQNQIGEYINNFIDKIKGEYQISKSEVLKNSISNNLIITLVLWFLGSTIIGMPLIYLTLAYKGYCIGYSISAIIATLGIGKGIALILSSMLLQYIIYIPCILSLAVSGIRLHKLIVENRHTENIKMQLTSHTIFCTIILILLIIASLVETYISTNIANYVIKLY